MRTHTNFFGFRSARAMIFLHLIFCGSICFGQSIPVDSVLQTLKKVYINYDSTNYLSFDIRFNYTSDTSYGDYANDQLNGSYTLAGKRTKYSLGDIDFMQNDSFFIAVYNHDKIIIVDEPKHINAGSQLPLRNLMDSLVRQYYDHYTVSKKMIGVDTAMLVFTRADSLAQFDNFNISYDIRNYYLYNLDYQYLEVPPADSALGSLKAERKRRFSVRFSNYSLANYEDTVYSENNYIFFEKGICKPVAKYRNFKVYNSKPVIVAGPAE